MHATPVPPDAYVDTGVFMSATITGLAHAQPCNRFLWELVDAGAIVYYSPILPLEVANAFRNAAIRDPRRVPNAVRQRFSLGAWRTDPAVRAAWLRFGLGTLEEWLDRFQLAVPLMWDAAILREAERLMAAHDLNSHDALHWATAAGHGIPHFAAVDREFLNLTDGPIVLLLRDDLPYPFA